MTYNFENRYGKPPYHKTFYSNEQDYTKFVIDLDYIVYEFTKSMCTDLELIKNMDDYNLAIDWRKLNIFQESETQLIKNENLSQIPFSKTVLQTRHLNPSSKERDDQLKIEYKTTQTCIISFNKGFKTSIQGINTSNENLFHF
jgi:hypothetical protein